MDDQAHKGPGDGSVNSYKKGLAQLDLFSSFSQSCTSLTIQLRVQNCSRRSAEMVPVASWWHPQQGLPDLANKNTRQPVKCEFHMNSIDF
jgi:hypothetical protein